MAAAMHETRGLSRAWLAWPATIAWLFAAAAANAQPAPQEPPILAEAVAKGELPPVAERMPAQPYVIDLQADGRSNGHHGGTLHTLVRKHSDSKLLVIYGYARLVGYTPELELKPDLLESVTVEEGRIFTLKLREGHRWSDGHPFTAEDFRYYWEDVANNELLSPSGLPSAMMPGKETPQFEVLDQFTVRYTWSRPNPFFLPRLAGAYPLFIYRPAHYMKQFHARYADKDALATMAKDAAVESWAALHEKRGNLYKLSNPDLPTLQPWKLTSRPPVKRMRAVRNPYYHRMDGEGRQLPYIDEVLLQVTGGGLIPAKTATGESDLQARGLTFKDIVVMKEAGSEKIETLLWSQGVGSQLALFPNLNANDPAWRTLLRDVRFRRALSLAVDRNAINNFLYFGLARPSNNTVLPYSPLFRPQFADSWIEYNLDQANALLDEIGLTKRDKNGFRLLPDGRSMELIVETAGEVSEQVDTLELISSNWQEIGIKLLTKPLQREVVRRRITAGETLMSAWTGITVGTATADTTPDELVPDHRYDPQWPKWGAYYQTDGQSGEPVDMPEVARLLELYTDWANATDDDVRTAAWQEMLAIHADQQFSIGTVAGVRQPVVISKRLMNVPEEAVYAWHPGAIFGIYQPDTFWFQQ